MVEKPFTSDRLFEGYNKADAAIMRSAMRCRFCENPSCTKRDPTDIRGIMRRTAVGNFVAGKIGEATGGEGGEMTKEGTLSVYSTIGWWTIGVGVVVLLLSPIVKRWMHLDTLRDDNNARAAS